MIPGAASRRYILARTALLLFVVLWSLAMLDFSLYAHRWDPRSQQFVHLRDRFLSPAADQAGHRFDIPAIAVPCDLPTVCPVAWLFSLGKESVADSSPLCGVQGGVSVPDREPALPIVPRPILAVAPKQSPPSA
jgi:hypothetical protein